MRLRALEVEQFRKFEARARVAGFGEGLNVLCGPNEFGKSTLLAAIRAVLFERFSSRAETVRRLQSWRGNAAPFVAMEFALGDETWRIEKRFLQSPMARLSAGGGGVFDGDAAEEKLQSLLGFGAAGRKGGAGEQMGLWGALWVTQRQSADQADFSSELARATVSRCLEAEVGVLTGGERGEAVRKAAEAQLGRLLDGNGRPRERYKAVIGEIAALEGSLAVLRARAERLRADGEAFRRTEAQLRRAEDPAAAQRLAADLEDARRRRDAAQVAAEKRAAAQAALDKAVVEERAALREVEARAARRRGLASAEAAETAAQQGEAAAREVSAVAEAALAAARLGAQGAEQRAAEATAGARRQREVLALVGEASALQRLEAALAAAGPVQSEIEAVLARLAGVRIDRAGVEAVRKAAREHEVAQAALLAQATAIEIEAVAAGAMTLDGVALPAGRSAAQVVAESVIGIAGVGSIRVRPAMQDREKVAGRAAKAARALSASLADCGCVDAAAAENAWRERETLEARLVALRGEMARLAPIDAAGGVALGAASGGAPGLASLGERAGVLRLRVQAGLERLGLETPPALAAAESARMASEREEDAAGLALREARAGLDQAVQGAAGAREALIGAEGEARNAAAACARLRAEQAAAEAEEDASALEARREGAAGRRAEAEAVLRRMSAEAGGDTVEAMAMRIQRYEQAMRQNEVELRRLREALVELRTRIRGEGGAGLDEDIAAQERSLAALVREREASARDVELLRLLLETLNGAERETKQRYMAPVTRRVTPYLRALFPGADIECDESLRITGVARDGAELREFERLSDGTQEQIAVLARLAFAELLRDQGKPAMVILDDALAWSDDERMERMFDVLGMAARRMQILVLSCRADVFSRLGGTRLRVE